MGKLDPKLQEILERHAREKSKFQKNSQPKTDKQSLEDMFGKEAATRMRRDADINALRDHLSDP